MSSTLDIQWSGRSYSDQIENLDAALSAASDFITSKGELPSKVYGDVLSACEEDGEAPVMDLWTEAERVFAAIAFEGWMTEPDGWSLVA